MSEGDRLDQAQEAGPDAELADAMKPAAAPVTAEQLARGLDADPADVAEQGPGYDLAEDSHDEGGPGDQHSG